MFVHGLVFSCDFVLQFPWRLDLCTVFANLEFIGKMSDWITIPLAEETIRDQMRDRCEPEGSASRSPCKVGRRREPERIAGRMPGTSGIQHGTTALDGTRESLSSRLRALLLDELDELGKGGRLLAIPDVPEAGPDAEEVLKGERHPRLVVGRKKTLTRLYELPLPGVEPRPPIVHLLKLAHLRLVSRVLGQRPHKVGRCRRRPVRDQGRGREQRRASADSSGLHGAHGG